MFLSRNKKNNVYPSKPQFYYIKVGFKGVKIIKACFRDDYSSLKRYFRTFSVYALPLCTRKFTSTICDDVIAIFSDNCYQNNNNNNNNHVKLEPVYLNSDAAM